MLLYIQIRAFWLRVSILAVSKLEHTHYYYTLLLVYIHTYIHYYIQHTQRKISVTYWVVAYTGYCIISIIISITNHPTYTYTLLTIYTPLHTHNCIHLPPQSSKHLGYKTPRIYLYPSPDVLEAPVLYKAIITGTFQYS